MLKAIPDTFDLASLKGWEELQSDEQATLRKETEMALEDLEAQHKSRLSFGKHLVSIHEILKPRGMWIDYLEQVFHMSVPTAYRYMELYRSVNEKLPKPLLVIALRRGLEIRPRALDATPLPKSDDPKKIQAFFDKISKPTPRIISIDSSSSDEITKECLNFVVSRAKKIPGRGRIPFLKNFVGILIGQLSPSSEDMTFSPTPMPDAYKVLRGRPKRIAA